MTATVVGFVGARRRAFLLELRRINAEFRKRRSRIRGLSVDRWWFEDDPAYALACAQAEITRESLALRLEQCAAAARRYGANPAPFERALHRWTPENAA